MFGFGGSGGGGRKTGWISYAASSGSGQEGHRARRKFIVGLEGPLERGRGRKIERKEGERGEEVKIEETLKLREEGKKKNRKRKDEEEEEEKEEQQEQEQKQYLIFLTTKR
ncbi:hypothetical protein E2C01_095669 [Portunus trituberculatus]|uniref:Uncharacterized protein n=1 Tax=Portunus trituberculatus TaxID=210409 RepID=A0A5B7JTL4_PORTR|nr:hypothetical protein [Portunus trituberculatus]